MSASPHRIGFKQRDVFNRMLHGDKTTLVLAGATRSGKTWVASLAHAAWIAQNGGGHDHLLAGRTATTAWRNAGETMTGFLRAFGCVVHHNASKQMLLIDTPSGRARMWLLGANDVQARTKIQGATLQSAHVDEAPTTHEDFLPFLWTRFSTDPARLLMSLNPESPLSKFKRTVIDRPANWDADVISFTFDDNPALSEAAKERIKAGLTGHWYQRLVLGQWAGASGLVFPRKQWSDDVPKAPVWHVGFDWASASVAGAVLLASEADDGRWPWRSVVVDEWRHDARTDRTLTDAETADKVHRWAQSATNGADPASVSVFVDPSTHAGFQRLLADRGYSVRDGVNDVLPGIADTDARLAAGNVAIKPDACRHLEAELAAYAWDEKAAERGEDRPVKAADHLVDALRYAVASTCRKSALDEWADAFA